MASCMVDQKRTATERFKQLAVRNVCANSGVMLQNHEIVLVIIIVGKRVLERLVLSGTSVFGKVERTSVMRLCISGSTKNVQISASRYTVPE